MADESDGNSPSGFTVSRALLLFILVGGMLCFFPVFSGMPSALDVDTYSIRSSVQSCAFQASSYATLGLCLATAMDFLIDFMEAEDVVKINAKHNGRMKVLIDEEKAVLFLGVFVQPMVAMIPSSTTSLALIYCCASNAQILLIGGYMMVLCNRYYHRYFSTPLTIFCVTTFVVTNVVQIWVQNQGHDFSTARLVTFAMQLAGPVLFMLFIIPWFYKEVWVNLAQPWLREMLLGSHEGPRNVGSQQARMKSISRYERTSNPCIELIEL